MKSIRQVMGFLLEGKLGTVIFLGAAIVLLIAFYLAAQGLISHLLDRKYDRELIETKEQVEQSETEAQTHREKVAELDAERPALARRVAATDKQIKKSKRREVQINAQIAHTIEERDRALVAVTADLDTRARRARLCAGFEAEGIESGDYCKGSQ